MGCWLAPERISKGWSQPLSKLALDANTPGVFVLRDGANRPLHQLRTGRFVILFYPRIADLPPYIVDLVKLQEHFAFR